MNNMDMTFFNYVAILGSLILGFTGFKIAGCKPFKEDGEDFQLKVLLLGLGRHLIAIVALTIVYVVCSSYGSELAVININGTEFTIPAALNLIMLATITYYSVKLIKNAAEYFGVGDKFSGVNEPKEVEIQTTFNNDSAVAEEAENIKG